MRFLSIVLVVLLVLVQFPLWLGKGGWLRAWDLERQVALQQRTNDRLLERNKSLEGEVKDLRDGIGAIEERARYELGMLRSEEIFVQLPEAVSASGRLQAGTEPSGPLASQGASLPKRPDPLTGVSAAQTGSTSR